MATKIKDLIPVIRDRLIETQPNFWGDDELVKIVAAGCRDLWRSVVDLKQEYYLTIDTTHVTLAANTATLTGVPSDVHKVYLIEPLDLTTNGANNGLIFKPLDYNHESFQLARSRAAIDPVNDTIFYALHSQGAPVAAPTIPIAPQVTSAVSLSFSYVPILGTLTQESTIPVPGEADNALTAWTVAYALSKEDPNRSPHPGWLSIYATEKQNLLQSLGIRQLQEPIYVDALFEQYW